MTKHFTEAETAEWIAGQPKVPLLAKIVVQNAADDVLIVKPNYKPGWSLPGGLCEEHESPLDAVLRETAEETALQLKPGDLRFLAIRFGIAKQGATFVHVVFAARIDAEAAGQVKIPADELEEFRWVRPDTLASFVQENAGPLAELLLKTKQAGVYSDNDQHLIAP